VSTPVPTCRAREEHLLPLKRSGRSVPVEAAMAPQLAADLNALLAAIPHRAFKGKL
jgi:hypothetical protein